MPGPLSGMVLMLMLAAWYRRVLGEALCGCATAPMEAAMNANAPQTSGASSIAD